MKSGRPTVGVDAVSAKPERLSLFDHLPKKQALKNNDVVEGDRILHPATLKLGALYSKGLVQTDDDRVTSLVAVFCNLLQDYKTPPKKALREDLDKYISKQVWRGSQLGFTLNPGSFKPFVVQCVWLLLGSISCGVSGA